MYWVDKLDVMCLWYGGTTKHNNLVTVLPIGTPKDPSAASAASSATPKSTSAGASEGQALEVKRSLLLPLDEEVLHSRCSNTLLRDFGLALCHFAEWDDYARDSYVWPEFISRVMGSKLNLDCWFKYSTLHPLANRAGTQESRVRFFFFLLCAEHQGLNGEYMATDRFVRGERVDSCSREMLDLITHISLSLLDLQGGHLDNRFTSRVGKQYQTHCWSKLAKDGERLEPPADESSGSEPLFSPSSVSAEAAAEYMEAVLAACRANVRVGQLLEAPTQEWVRRRQQGAEDPELLATEAPDILIEGSSAATDTGTSTSAAAAATESTRCTVSTGGATKPTASSTEDAAETSTSGTAVTSTSTAEDGAASSGEYAASAANGTGTECGGGMDMSGEEEQDGTDSLTSASAASPAAGGAGGAGTGAALAKKKAPRRSIACVVVRLGKMRPVLVEAPAAAEAPAAGSSSSSAAGAAAEEEEEAKMEVEEPVAAPSPAQQQLNVSPEESEEASKEPEEREKKQEKEEEVELRPLPMGTGDAAAPLLDPLPLPAWRPHGDPTPASSQEQPGGGLPVIEPVTADLPLSEQKEANEKEKEKEQTRPPLPPSAAPAAKSASRSSSPAPTTKPAPTEFAYDEAPDEHGRWVTVYDGRDQWSVPLQMCRLYNMPEDKALRLLSARDCSLPDTLAYVHDMLGAQEGDLLSNAAGFTRADMDAFLHIAQRHPTNIRKIWLRFNQRNDSAAGAAVKEEAGEKGKNPPGRPPKGGGDKDKEGKSQCSTRVVTLREMMSLFFLFFQGISDQEESGTSTAEARSLSRHSQSSRSYEHWGGGGEGHTLNQRVAMELAKFQMSTHDLMHIYARTLHQAHCWPANFPMNKYNIYWLKSNNQPCVCVGFDPEKQTASVVPICCATYHHEIQISVNNICPISAHMFKVCPDERAASFAMAMMDFAKWELSTAEVPLCRWYQYPKFIMRFFAHGPTFSSWRKTAERVVRGTSVDKRKAYFDKLVEDYITSEADESERLNVLHRFPFDDMSDSSGDESGADSLDEEQEGPVLTKAERKEAAQKEKKERKEKREREKKDKKDDKDGEPKKKRVRVAKEPEPEPEPELPSTPPPNEYNLFWSPKSNLPCLFYDRVQNLHQWTISVIPMCCTTYHYKITALRSNGQLESLTPKHMDLCTDERTTDFTLAMMDFADWHRSRLRRSVAEGHTLASCNDVDVWGNAHSVVDGVYMWPRFIAEMVEKPKVWALWRKKAERANSNGVSRRLAYLSALCADFQEYSAEYTSQPEGSRAVLDIRPDKPGPRELPPSKEKLAAHRAKKQSAGKEKVGRLKGEKDKDRDDKEEKKEKVEKKEKGEKSKDKDSGFSGHRHSSSSSSSSLPVHALILANAGSSSASVAGGNDAFSTSSGTDDLDMELSDTDTAPSRRAEVRV